MATQQLTLETRRATLADASVVSRLTLQLGYDCSEVMMRQRLARVRDEPEHAVFVAAIDGLEVVGWVHVELRKPLWCDPFSEIMGLVVSAHHRRLGVGRALVDRVRQWGDERKVRDLRARAQEHREDALSFYEALGFELYKEQQVYRYPDEAPIDPGGSPTLIE
ncbi:GNAT family N-acetyltransferase [Paraliomyxa miuraensis]|uniref:GNAT family N-acetyltransferase n=1 Tax=Paraliomyxa miuraensis TaxID=376150 RepID=UPI0022570193|nr:GNAT family N-acetyltransferase [Paraliomyxa miuraensis]MCX4240123.1 GNAT family N-acetyltransferase [Paraliomyxa miuraensis]